MIVYTRATTKRDDLRTTYTKVPSQHSRAGYWLAKSEHNKSAASLLDSLRTLTATWRSLEASPPPAGQGAPPEVVTSGIFAFSLPFRS